VGQVAEGGNGGRRLRRLLVAFLTLVAAACPPAAAQNAPRDRSLREQVGEASPEEGRLLADLDASAARKQELDARIAELDDEIAEVSSDLRAAEAHLGALQARQRAAEDRVAGIRRLLAAAEDELRQQAVAAYTGASDAGRVAVMLLRVSDVGELAAKRSYMRFVANTQAEAVATRERLRDEAEDLLLAADAAKAEAQAERNVVAAQRARLQRERNAHSAARRSVEAELARREGLVAELMGRRGEFQAQAAALAEQSAAVANMLRDDDAPSAPGGRLVSPIPGAPVVSSFGPRVHPVYGDVRVHTGVDINAVTGAPIRAAADGVVSSAGWLGGYGQATIVEHGGPMATLYAHQSAVLVSTGQRVTRGQVIGRVGCTGTCTGPHLHYEVRIDGNPVNPAPYL
jgi:murein DD-endopeptidase MepM/ murein hydrolase activator NlpD